MLHRFTVQSCSILIFLCWAVLSQGQITANFSANVTTGCTPVLIQFTDLSTSTASGIASWQWDFGDNTNTGVQNPAKVFNSAGLFTICLTVTDSLGNSDTLCLTDHISVASSPTAEFTGVPTAGCVPVSVQFTDQSIAGSNPINSWQWSFGTGASSGMQNPQFTYNNVNSYTVSLTVTDQNGCSDQMVKSGYITVSDIPTANFTAATTQFCSFPAMANFANTTNVPTGANMEYKWYFGDGDSSSLQSPTHTYANPGNYDVMLISTDTGSISKCSDTITINDFIEVFSNNTLTFTNTPSSGCDNVTVQFTNTTTCPSTNWTWDFGDNTTSNLENPTHTYTSPGTYDVIFSAIVDGTTLVDTCFNCVTVNVTPTVDYTTTGTIATCFMPISASFAGTSNNANVTYLWDFGDTTSTAQNASHTWTEAGTYPVSLTVTSPEGCSNTIVKDTVFARPIVASYIENRVSSCIGSSIDFLDSTVSYYPITSWDWDFTDTTSTDQNPTITFSDTGSYDVTLIVTNSLGCIDTFTNTAFVGDSVVIDFVADDTTLCIDQVVNFTNLTNQSILNQVSNWSWDFGDGGTSTSFQPTYEYEDTGTYTVILTATYNNCDSKLEFKDYITVSPPKADFEADRDCAAPLQVTFIDKSVGADTYSWDFGVPSLTDDTSNVANPVYNYPGSGTYSIKLTVTNATTGCIHEETRTLILNAAEDVSVTLSDTAGCLPLIISVSNTSSLATYAWTANGAIINDTTLAEPTVTYNMPGTYDSITLVVTHPTGCVEEIVMPDTIRVSDLSVGLNANATSGCIPLNVGFTNTAFSTSPITSYIWDFGNGDSSTMATPTYTYTTTGSFQPTLTVTDAVGCTKTASLFTAVIPTAPNVDFISDTIACVGQTINFANLSTGVGLVHSWNFDDGNMSSQISPSHTFTSEGNYNVCLTITDINNCSNTFCRTVQIANPAANFTANNTTANCQALSVQFQDNSQNAATWFWDFGDSTTSTLQNPVKVYNTPGDYDVTLIVTSPSGCRDTLVQAGFIQISGPAVNFSFTPNSGCPGTVVDFTATGQNVTNFIWVWGDFTSTSVSGTGGNDTISISHVYNNGGTIIPALVVEDNSGCQLTFLASDTISIEDFGVDITKSIAAICDSGSVQLSANITSLTPVTSMQWTYGTPSQTSTNNNISLNLNTPGVYPIALTASNASCTRTTIDSIVVSNSPNAHFGSDIQQGCVPQMINFTDSSTILNDTIISYVWDLGNGILDSVQNTSYLYDTVGNYNVQLTVTSLSGCTSTASQNIGIFANPAVNAGIDTVICSGESYQLMASGTTGVTYSWNADPSLSCTNCADPIASPTVTTDYIVTATTADGCTDMDTVIINVNTSPIAHFGLSTQQGCVPQVINFTDSSSILNGTIISYAWDFGNGILDSTQNTSYTYDTASNYTVQLIVVASSGCADTTTQTVDIYETPVVNAGVDTIICNGDSYQLLATSSIIANYTWNADPSLSCTSCPNPIVTPNSTTDYIVTAETANLCVATDTITVVVNPKPIASIPNLPLTACDGASVSLTDGSTIASGSIVNWDWDFGNNTSSNIQNPTVVYSTPGNYTVTLIATSNIGCPDTTTGQVIINQTPTATASFDTYICQGEQATLTAGGGDTYSWSPSATLNCDTCPVVIAMPMVTTTYTLTATAANGCVDTDTVRVEVAPYPNPTLILSNDTTICLGDTIQLTASGGTTVLDYDWDTNVPGLSCYTNCNNPFAFPSQTTTYYITLTGLGGCTTTDSITVTVITPNADVITMPDQTVCEGDSVQLMTVMGNSHVWSPFDGLSCGLCPNPYAFPTETTTYTVTAIAGGCVVTDDITVNVIDPSTVNAGDDVGTCPGESVQLNATGAGQVTWSPSASLDNPNILNPVASPTETTDYILSIDNGSCVITDTVRVILINEALLEVQDVEICEGESVVLPVEALADGFVWTPADGLSSDSVQNPIASPTVTTTYTVTANLTNCTSSTADLTVTVNPLPDVSGFPVQEIFPILATDIALDVEVNPNYTYQWWSTVGDSIFSCSTCPDPQIAGLNEDARLYVQVTSLEGCTTLDSIDLRIISDCEDNLMVVPNAFTPNGDGLNDVLFVRGSGLTEIITFRIFSRTGQNVFSSNTKEVGWDGTYNGIELNTGIYVYYAEAICPISGNVVRKQGNVMLMRN